MPDGVPQVELGASRAPGYLNYDDYGRNVKLFFASSYMSAQMEAEAALSVSPEGGYRAAPLPTLAGVK